jgi:hypothetical protein
MTGHRNKHRNSLLAMLLSEVATIKPVELRSLA